VRRRCFFSSCAVAIECTTVVWFRPPNADRFSVRMRQSVAWPNTWQFGTAQRHVLGESAPSTAVLCGSHRVARLLLVVVYSFILGNVRSPRESRVRHCWRRTCASCGFRPTLGGRMVALKAGSPPFVVCRLFRKCSSFRRATVVFCDCKRVQTNQYTIQRAMYCLSGSECSTLPFYEWFGS
jgi:hypothetical protein